jgi:hypothetical protein
MWQSTRLHMQLSLGVLILAAMLGISACLFSAAFRAVAKDCRQYNWHLLVRLALAVVVAFWCLPLVVIKDTFSSAIVILWGVYSDYSHPVGARQDSSYFDYFRQLLVRFAIYSVLSSIVLAWWIHCVRITFRQKSHQSNVPK